MARIGVVKSSNRNGSNLTSGAAGASLGTVLLALAKNIDDSNPLKSWLILIAPTVTLAIAWCAKEILKIIKRKQAKNFKKELKLAIEAAMVNPHANKQDVEKLKRKLIELEMADIETLSNKIQSIENSP